MSVVKVIFTLIQRVIAHENFSNVSYKEAVMRLNQMEQGDCIIRPSSKGADHLTCSWKIHDGVTGHIDIKEDDKINNYTLGKRLFIANEVCRNRIKI